MYENLVNVAYTAEVLEDFQGREAYEGNMLVLVLYNNCWLNSVWLLAFISFWQFLYIYDFLYIPSLIKLLINFF